LVPSLAKECGCLRAAVGNQRKLQSLLSTISMWRPCSGWKFILSPVLRDVESAQWNWGNGGSIWGQGMARNHKHRSGVLHVISWVCPASTSC